MSTATSSSQKDEVEIRRLMDNWTKALEAKDVNGLLADYAPDALLFDAIPPYKTVGKEAMAAVWNGCFPYFPEKFKSEHRDVKIHVAGDVAIMHCLHHFVPEEADHPCGQTWMRVTTGWRRIGGAWKVIHEHVSIPFNPMNNQAWFIRDPNVTDTPDYSAAGG